MNDRELLVSAAKAMGYGDGHWEGGSWLEVRYGLSCAWWSEKMFEELDEGYWNPLESDAQAFRLAVKLGINLEIGKPGFGDVQAGKRDDWAVEWLPPDDPCAATRRAIVRAAAEIGKKLGAPAELG